MARVGSGRAGVRRADRVAVRAGAPVTARIVAAATAADPTRVTFDACSLVRIGSDQVLVDGVRVRVTADLDPAEFRDLLAAMLAEYRRQGGSDL